MRSVTFSVAGVGLENSSGGSSLIEPSLGVHWTCFSTENSLGLKHAEIDA